MKKNVKENVLLSGAAARTGNINKIRKKNVRKRWVGRL